jgi:D-xylose 1-dehydrogenase (NADP+, D-xylono-1,5-lactone-forming)
MSQVPIRIGVLGAADIARAFIKAVAPSTRVKVTAVASRSLEKARAFAAETGVERAYGDYWDLLQDRDIDAIYNPLPNSLHAEWSINACRAHKHVLCEKPLAASEVEAKEMFAAARRFNVHLVEAYPYLAQPMTIEARKLVASGAIGKPQFIRATFGIPFADPNNIRLKPDLAGGALMDAGSYAVSFVRVMAGERPSRVHAVARYAQTGVDNMLAGTMEFPSGLVAQVAASFTTGYQRHGHVSGDKGSIETMFLNHPPIGGPSEIRIRRGPQAISPVETIALPEGNGFLAEAESFARLLTDGATHWTGASQAESVDIAAILAALLESARTGTFVHL